MIGYWHHPVVCLSVCDAVHCGSQGRCTGLKVTPACSSQACSYLSPQTFLLRMCRFATKCTTKKTSRRNTSSDAVSLELFSVVFSECVQKRKSEVRFFRFSRSWARTCNHRLDSSPVVYERPARSVPRFALITAPVLTFLFTGRDAAITVNSVKIDSVS